MNSKFRTIFAITMAVTLAFFSLPNAAQTYPSRTITVVNPWPAGGVADSIVRPVMQRLATKLNTSIVVDNKPGANGMIGATFVAKAPPDGYTIYVAHVGTMAISPALVAKMPFDTLTDFVPITQMVSGSLVLVMRKEIPVNTIPELIAYAKARPDQISYGSSGNGSTNHLSGALLARMSNTSMLHVPYKGDVPLMADLLGGQISMGFMGLSAAMPYLNDGRLRGIAVTTLKRSAVLPNLPTIAETLPGYEVNSWYGLMAPAGTPKPIVELLHKEATETLNTPEIVTLLKQRGLEVVGSTPDQYTTKIKEDMSRWATLIKATGIKLE